MNIWVITLLVTLVPHLKESLVKVDRDWINCIGASLQGNSDLRISYIGNMGVLFEANSKTVLIDGLHEKYKPAYQYPTNQMVDELINGHYEGFTEIEINLVTHNHQDHFSAKISLDFLRANAQSITVGAPQIKEEMTSVASESDRQLLERVRGVAYDYQVHDLNHKGIHIKSIGCDHTYQIKHKGVQNLAFLIELDAYRILHLGDTDWDLAAGIFEKLKTTETEIDIAVLPYWMLLGDGARTSISDLIDPGQILVSHIDPNLIDQVEEDTKLGMPNVVFLHELMETIKYSK